MNIRIEGYDEYVKDFEKARNTTEVLPKTEEEIREVVEERISEHGTDFYDHWTCFLEKEYSCTGRNIGFLFETKLDEEGANFYVRYQTCG